MSDFALDPYWDPQDSQTIEQQQPQQEQPQQGNNEDDNQIESSPINGPKKVDNQPPSPTLSFQLPSSFYEQNSSQEQQQLVSSLDHDDDNNNDFSLDRKFDQNDNNNNNNDNVEIEDGYDENINDNNDYDHRGNSGLSQSFGSGLTPTPSTGDSFMSSDDANNNNNNFLSQSMSGSYSNDINADYPTRDNQDYRSPQQYYQQYNNHDQNVSPHQQNTYYDDDYDNQSLGGDSFNQSIYSARSAVSMEKHNENRSDRQQQQQQPSSNNQTNNKNNNNTQQQQFHDQLSFEHSHGLDSNASHSSSSIDYIILSQSDEASSLRSFQSSPDQILISNPPSSPGPGDDNDDVDDRSQRTYGNKMMGWNAHTHRNQTMSDDDDDDQDHRNNHNLSKNSMSMTQSEVNPVYHGIQPTPLEPEEEEFFEGDDQSKSNNNNNDGNNDNNDNDFNTSHDQILFQSTLSKNLNSQHYNVNESGVENSFSSDDNSHSFILASQLSSQNKDSSTSSSSLVNWSIITGNEKNIDANNNVPQPQTAQQPIDDDGNNNNNVVSDVNKNENTTNQLDFDDFRTMEGIDDNNNDNVLTTDNNTNNTIANDLHNTTELSSTPSKSRKFVFVPKSTGKKAPTRSQGSGTKPVIDRDGDIMLDFGDADVEEKGQNVSTNNMNSRASLPSAIAADPSHSTNDNKKNSGSYRKSEVYSRQGGDNENNDTKNDELNDEFSKDSIMINTPIKRTDSGSNSIVPTTSTKKGSKFTFTKKNQQQQQQQQTDGVQDLSSNSNPTTQPIDNDAGDDLTFHLPQEIASNNTPIKAKPDAQIMTQEPQDEEVQTTPQIIPYGTTPTTTTTTTTTASNYNETESLFATPAIQKLPTNNQQTPTLSILSRDNGLLTPQIYPQSPEIPPLATQQPSSQQPTQQLELQTKTTQETPEVWQQPLPLDTTPFKSPKQTKEEEKAPPIPVPATPVSIELSQNDPPQSSSDIPTIVTTPIKGQQQQQPQQQQQQQQQLSSSHHNTFVEPQVATQSSLSTQYTPTINPLSQSTPNVRLDTHHSQHQHQQQQSPYKSSHTPLTPQQTRSTPLIDPPPLTQQHIPQGTGIGEIEVSDEDDEVDLSASQAIRQHRQQMLLQRQQAKDGTTPQATTTTTTTTTKPAVRKGPTEEQIEEYASSVQEDGGAIGDENNKDKNKKTKDENTGITSFFKPWVISAFSVALVAVGAVAAYSWIEQPEDEKAKAAAAAVAQDKKERRR